MRPKDASKKDALFRAAQDIVIAEGFASVTMSKIARAANVAPATLYTYFANKDDMLNQLFIKLHSEMIQSIYESFEQNQKYEVWFRKIWRNIYEYFIAHPDDFMFCLHFENSPRMKNPCCHKETSAQAAKIRAVIEKGKKDGVIKDLPKEAMHAFVFSPIGELARMQLAGTITMTPELFEQFVSLAWDILATKQTQK